MTGIPAADLERAQQVVERLRQELAEAFAKLPYDSEPGADFRFEEGAE